MELLSHLKRDGRVEREDLALVGQEGDVDLLQRPDELGHGRLAQLVEQCVGAS